MMLYRLERNARVKESQLFHLDSYVFACSKHHQEIFIRQPLNAILNSIQCVKEVTVVEKGATCNSFRAINK